MCNTIIIPSSYGFSSFFLTLNSTTTTNTTTTEKSTRLAKTYDSLNLFSSIKRKGYKQPKKLQNMWFLCKRYRISLAEGALIYELN